MSPKADFIVARFVPRDIHRYSHASAAAVLLAAALDWDILEKPNRPTILRNHDGEVVIEVPDETNLKFNVFRSWIRKLATHSVEFVLPMEVVDKIAATAKLSPDHKRVLADFAQQSVVPDATPDKVDEPVEVYIVSREPYMAQLSGGLTYQSAASYRRVWSDGHEDWECVICGQAFTAPRALGGHRQKHINAGETEANYRDQVRKAAGDRPAAMGERATPHRIDAEPHDNGTAPLPLTDEEWQPFAEAIGITEPDAEPEVVPEVVPESEATPSESLELRFAELGHYVQEVLDENARLKQQLATMKANVAAMLSLIQELQSE